MRKILLLLLAGAIFTGAGAHDTQAIDFKASGHWLMAFDYGQHGNFTGGKGHTGFDGGSDEFSAAQRVRLKLNAVASETLSGTVFFEIGKSVWGTSGAALGGDATIVKVKQAYLDWAIPKIDLKVRMGLQGISLAGYTMGNQVLFDDVTGITASLRINDYVSVTALWFRAYNDNGGYTDHNGNVYDNFMDNTDAFALLVPLTFDGVKITPWGMYAAVGAGSFESMTPGSRSDFVGASAKNFAAGMFSGFGKGTLGSQYGNALWAGVTGEISYWDLFRVAWDFTYGSVAYGNETWDREGWIASLLLEYNMEWCIPGLYGWYASGDDGSASNGSERLPSISTNNLNNGFSNFAFSGNPYIPRESLLSYNMSGTWGIGIHLKDISFIENLKHTLRLNLIGGTNNPNMAKKYVPYMNSGFYGDIGFDPMYMTTNDYALEVGLTNTYKIYENLTLMVDACYIALWNDNDTWNDSPMRTSTGITGEKHDAWNIGVTFAYVF